MIITIVCGAESHKRQVIESFMGLGGDRWQGMTVGSDRQVGSDAVLFGDQVLPRSIATPASEGATQLALDEYGQVTDLSVPIPRRRYNLTCKRCGLSLELRGPKMYSVLNQLAAAGVSEVSLTALVATVT